MIGGRVQIHQLEPGFSDEFRVVGKDLDCPRHLIDDALSRPMTRRKKLKIFEPIVVAISGSFVMDCFVGVKFAAKVLLHHMAMLKNLSPLDAVLVRKPQSDIALASDVALNLSLFGWTKAFVLRQLKGFSTLRTAKRAAPVAGTSPSPLWRDGFSALSAIVNLSQALSLASTFASAVQRFLSPMISVASKAPRQERKAIAAVVACEVDRVRRFVCASVYLLVGAVTHLAAKLSDLSVFDTERVSAVQASLIDKHGCLSDMVQRYSYSTPCLMATPIEAGVA